MRIIDLKCLAFSIVAGSLACGGVVEPDRDTEAPLQTDRLSYSFVADDRGFYSTGTFELEVSNTSGKPAYLTRGDRQLELVLEGFENGEWVTVWAQSIGDGAAGLRLDPGESATFAAEIDGFLPGACECSPIISFDDGLYRLRIAQGYVELLEEEPFETGEELPTEHRVSNRFFVDSPR